MENRLNSVVIKCEPLEPSEVPENPEGSSRSQDLTPINRQVKVENEHSGNIQNPLFNRDSWRSRSDRKRKYCDDFDSERDRLGSRKKRACKPYQKSSFENRKAGGGERKNAEKYFKCTQCSKNFPTLAQVNQHFIDKHKEEKPHSTIQEIFEDKLNQFKHMDRKHTLKYNIKYKQQSLYPKKQMKQEKDPNNNIGQNIKNSNENNFITKLRQFVNNTRTKKQNLECDVCHHDQTQKNKIKEFLNHSRSSFTSPQLPLCQRFLDDFLKPCSNAHNLIHEIRTCGVCGDMANLQEYIKENMAFVELFIMWVCE